MFSDDNIFFRPYRVFHLFTTVIKLWSCGFIVLFLVFIPDYSVGRDVECDRNKTDCQDFHAWRLNYDLFDSNGYNRLIRPVRNTSDSLTINFTLFLSTIINVDSVNQYIITNVWLQMAWHDYQLAWDPKEYGNIGSTRTSADTVWTPDIVLFNNADGVYEPNYIPNVVINSNGDAKFIPPAIYTSSCSIDVEYFPFDQQECEMKFGSWTFLGKSLHYQFHNEQKNMDMSDYMRNGAWDIIRAPGEIRVIPDTITGEPKEIIVYTLIIRRKTLFYTVNLIIPCFLHALVCLCVFVLPADTRQKMSLVISVLVSLTVFLVLVQKILPPSMNIPLIGKYLLFTFIMNVLEILVTVLIIFANHKSPRADVMPRWVCWLLLYKLPKFLLMERPDHDARWQPKSCAEPPSYPATPQIARAATVRGNQRNRKNRIPSDSSTTASRIDSRCSRENDRVNSLRKEYTMYQGSGSSGQSSMGSCSHITEEDSSAGAEVAESLGADHQTYPLPPFHGHRCMLREGAMARSDDTLDEEVRPMSPETVQLQRDRETPDMEPHPLWFSREVRSGMNAVKFIWRQMQNKEEYDTVRADWKYVAAVMDRLLMVIFILVTLGGTLGVLVNAPHILEKVDEEKNIETILKGG